MSGKKVGFKPTRAEVSHLVLREWVNKGLFRARCACAPSARSHTGHELAPLIEPVARALVAREPELQLNAKGYEIMYANHRSVSSTLPADLQVLLKGASIGWEALTLSPVSVPTLRLVFYRPTILGWAASASITTVDITGNVHANVVSTGTRDHMVGAITGVSPTLTTRIHHPIEPIDHAACYNCCLRT